MHIVLLCATHRGILFLKKLITLAPSCHLTVFSFRETPAEPPFLDEIRQLTESHGAQFFEARDVSNQSFADFWAATPPDLMLVVSWRYLVPARIYCRPARGTYVFHDSLLPKYRGFSPTVWAMINGEDHTGVTLFKIAQEMDSGPIADQRRVPISPNDTIKEVMKSVTDCYLELLEANIAALLDGAVPLQPQNELMATYTCKRVPEDDRLDWTMPTSKILCLIRAVTAPYSGAYTFLEGRRLRIWAAELPAISRTYVGGIPGRVIEVTKDIGSKVLTGEGQLLLTSVQWEGEAPCCASMVLNKLSHTLA
jgi:methionyl-tRNA formyltransferase